VTESVIFIRNFYLTILIGDKTENVCAPILILHTLKIVSFKAKPIKGQVKVSSMNRHKIEKTKSEKDSVQRSLRRNSEANDNNEIKISFDYEHGVDRSQPASQPASKQKKEADLLQ